MDNYFTLSKVIERILMNKTEHFILTSDNQFGFKLKHGTDGTMEIGDWRFL